MQVHCFQSAWIGVHRRLEPGWVFFSSLLGWYREEASAMTVIEIPDDQAAVLKAKAAAQGLTLTAWLGKLAEEERAVLKTKKSGYGLLAQYGPGPSAEEIDKNRREMFRGFAEDFE
jgi:hypothetical protein